MLSELLGNEHIGTSYGSDIWQEIQVVQVSYCTPPSSLVSLLLPPRFAAEAITCAGVCQYIHRIEGALMLGGASVHCDHLELKGVLYNTPESR